MSLNQKTLPRLEEDYHALPAAGIGAIETSHGNLPLNGIDIRSRVDGLACRTVITQVFRNTHSEFVEATYLFPLPGKFAVTGCTMRVKDRVIDAELKERSQARADYDEAIRQGHRASIAEEDRSETFSLRVGNIAPREEVTVELTLIGTVSIVQGQATLRIPMVVAPKYISGQPLDGPSVGDGTAVDTDEVPDASRVTPPTLLNGFPNPVALSVEVTLDPGRLTPHDSWRDQIHASLHSVLVSQEGLSRMPPSRLARENPQKKGPCKIRLQPGERVNRDFVLRWPLLQESIQSSLDYSGSKPDQPGTFVATIMPPADYANLESPRDIVFVLDRSGSMDGWKIGAARRAVARMIDSLHDHDRFRVLAFDNTIESPDGTDWKQATDQNRWRAAEWIAQIDARGGTELGGALRSTIQHFATFGMPENRDAVVVLVTDGQVGGEDSVLRTIESLNLPRMPRIYTMGIDRAVNGSLLTKLADLGGGTFELVESERRLDEVMERFHRDIGTPILTDVQVEPLDFDLVKNSQTPAHSTNVFADRPLMIFGRIAGPADTIRLRVTGNQSNGQPWQVELTARVADVPTLLPLWGRNRIRDLEDEIARGKGGKRQSEIVRISLECNVLSRFTSYLAVDQDEVVNPGGYQHKIVQPVETPEGWAPVKGAFVGGRRAGRAAKRRRTSQSGLPPEEKLLHCIFGRAGDDVEDTSLKAGRDDEGVVIDAKAYSAAQLVPESVARENNIVPLSDENGTLHVQISDPNDQDTIEKLRFILNREIKVETKSAEEIKDAIDRTYGPDDGNSADSMLQEFTDAAIDFAETDTITGPYDTQPSDDSAPIVRLVQLLLTEAIQLGASHIYLEPCTTHLRVVYIIAALSKERDCPPLRLHAAIVSRLKILSKLSPDETGLATGSLTITHGENDRTLQCFFIPTSQGMSIVIQMLGKPAEISKDSPPAEVNHWLANAKKACGDSNNSVYQQLVSASGAMK